MRTIKIELRLCSDDEYRKIAGEGLYNSGARAFTGWNGEDDVFIVVNLGAVFFSLNERLRLLAHELGHALGYKHSKIGIMAPGNPLSFFLRLIP